MNERKFPTPSQFYRNRRPEYFSDSKIVAKVVLPREQLDFELSQISINLKHDSFATLCRKLAEKLISPNLIPQVGPTGGGDGKTDTETYPVSEFISDRWFVSNNKWNENENWAFAISAKQKWKPKVISDVNEIIGTKRGYTKIFFFSNQKISDKNRKDTQDKIKLEYNVELIILDAEWILENVYSNKLLNVVIESLNLSRTYIEEINIMKFIKTYSIFESLNNQLLLTKEEIENWCRIMEIRVSMITINDDLTVDVNGSVDISNKDLHFIPIQFGRVKDRFDCSNNKLSSLKGSPREVGHDFECGNNMLSSLKGSPRIVEGDFDCQSNQLITFNGGPISIKGAINCINNKLTSLKGCAKNTEVIFCDENNLVSFKGFPNELKEIGCSDNPVYEIYELFNENPYCIKWINEFNVIRKDNIILENFKEVLYMMDINDFDYDRLKKLKNYKLI